MNTLKKPFIWLYSHTIDHTKFREISQRYLVFTLPLFYYGNKVHTSGIIITICAVLIRAWAAGYLKKDQELACEGPYILARHPLYLGSCLLALGLIFTIQHWFVTLFLGGLTFLTYNHTIRHEEKNLNQRFGKAYADLSKNTGPLWPKPAGIITALKNPSKLFQGFSFSQYKKNKEYECLLGVLSVFLILFLLSNHS